MENKLKEDTKNCIERLKEGNIDCKIISGDNILTTMHAALESGIMEKEKARVIV
jgi:cation-transporting P-type ATPase 13A2